ncbi:MAG: NUDIX hydrolase [Xanthomonadales bacterium]|nr:NUDIX hydrolase [Xanthomonadales bacterium]
MNHNPPLGSAALPRITVATVVPRDGRFLFVEERVRGRLVINQPAGHLEPDEQLAQAAVRETLEETGWHIELTGLLAVYHWPHPPDRKPVLRFTFVGRALDHEADRPLDDGIVRCLWLTGEELASQPSRLRSPLVQRSLADFHTRPLVPLSLIDSISASTAPMTSP